MRKSSLRFLLSAIALQVLILSATAQKPNIILIVTDDQSFNSIAYAGGGVFTPCIDSLAGEGMKFTNAHHPSTVCSPSRYSMLTGKFPGRCRADNFMEAFPEGTPTRVENNVELRKDEAHLGTILGQNGYKTGFVGKSHIMEHDILQKANWSSYGLQTYAQTDDPYNPVVNAKMKHNHDVYQEIVRSYGFDYADGIYMANVKELNNDALNIHNLEWTVDKARKFIEQEKDNPFFLYFSTTLHHGPVPWSKRDGIYWAGLDADPKLTGEGMVDTTWDFMPGRQVIKDKVLQNGYDASTGYTLLLDEGIRSIYKQVVDMGIEDNTLIIFIPDHGMWRHGKATLYDYGTKVPMFMYWKGSIAPGSVYSGLMQTVDFAPTIIDLAGATFAGDSAFDGFSLKNIVETGSGTSHESLFADFGYARSVKTAKWKYIAVRYPEEVQSQIDNGYLWTGYDGGLLDLPYLCRNSHLGHYASQKNPLYFEMDQLFDLEADYEETVNVYDQYPEVVDEMKSLLSGYLKDFEMRPFGEFTRDSGEPPLRASFPEPRSDRDNIDKEGITLSWQSGGGASSHDVYFGTSDPPPFIANQVETSYTPGNLDPLTTYYWRIDELNENGKTTGNTWSFTTQSGLLSLPFKKYIYTDLAENEIRDQKFEVINVRDQDVGISAIAINGADASFFEVLEDNITGTILSPGAKRSFTVRYKPGTSGGNHTASVLITSDLGDDDIKLVSKDIKGVYRKTIERFDSIGSWTSQNAMSVNNESHMEGGACLQISGKEPREFLKKFSTPLRTQATAENGYLQFWYYVSDVSKYASNNQVEIGSGGTNDVDEYNWNLNGKLSNGWNLVSLKFSEANITPSDGNPDLRSINHIRIYHGKTDIITVRIDGMQVIDSTVTAPEMATIPEPFNNATEVSKQADLSWTTGSRTSLHYVYFGKENPPLFLKSVSNSSFDLAELESNTTYYWRVDEMNEAGITTGEQWSFTTEYGSTGYNGTLENNKFSIAPNPSQGIAILELDKFEDQVTIRVFNMHGRKVYQAITETLSTYLNLTNLDKGNYVVEVSTTKARSSTMIILE